MDLEAEKSSERSRLELDRELRASEARFSVICESSPLGIFLANDRGECIYINPAARQITGLTAQTAAGRGWMRALHPEDRESIATRWGRAVGEPGDYQPPVHRFVRPDGAVRSVQVRAVQLARTPGEERAFLGILEDVTDQLDAEHEYLKQELCRFEADQRVIGRSPALRSVMESARLVAATATTVLITGETGTGKELVAQAIHEASTRRDRMLVKLNCAAISAGLVESELFGHEKGAFTGALRRRKGRFELAHGGTLFLDEVGELPLETQAKLLRVLQEREFERVGGNETLRVDVRVIAATNRNLAQMVEQGRFRQDLLYRLDVFPLSLPALRERSEDIPLLALSFVRRFARRSGKRIERISEEALERLLAYHWPGNVRELENAIERAVILAQGTEIGVEALPDAPRTPANPRLLAAVRAPKPDEARPTLEQMTQSYVARVLEETHWVIEGERGAARRLGIHPNTLRSRLKRWGLRRPGAERGLAPDWESESRRRCG